MPYVESIKVFCRVVELGSITSGGRDMRLTPAVASNRIKELEKRLGVRLFDEQRANCAPQKPASFSMIMPAASLTRWMMQRPLLRAFQANLGVLCVYLHHLVLVSACLRRSCPLSRTAILMCKFSCACPIARSTFWKTASTSPSCSATRLTAPSNNVSWPMYPAPSSQRPTIWPSTARPTAPNHL